MFPQKTTPDTPEARRLRDLLDQVADCLADMGITDPYHVSFEVRGDPFATITRPQRIKINANITHEVKV
jgi:hypothetical protein